MIRKLATVFGFGLFLLLQGALVFAQGYPSRATFLTAGFGCSPNQFAGTILGAPTTNGFICLGGYPNTSGGDGRIYMFKGGSIAATDYAYIRAGETTDPGFDFHLVNGAADSTKAYIGTDVMLWGDDSTTHNQFTATIAFQFYGLDDAGADTATHVFNADNSVNPNKFFSQLVTDGSTTGTFSTGTWDSNTSAIDSILSTATFTESTGALTSYLIDIADGNDELTITSGVITPFAQIQATSTGGGSGAPVYSFAGDTNNGIYSAVADETTIATAGSDQLTVSATSINIQNNDIIASDTTVEITDNVAITGNLSFTGTCSSCAAGSGVYGGVVDSAATAENVPTGWSVALSATCVYTVTHNLALGASNDMAMTVVPADGNANSSAFISSMGTNSFAYTTNNAAGNNCEAHAANFTAIVVAN